MTSSDREAAGVDIEEDAADLESQLMGLSLNETPAPAERKQASVLSADNPVFSRDWRSAKVRLSTKSGVGWPIEFAKICQGN